MPIRPDRFRQRYIFPTPRYISVAHLMKTQFEAQPWDLDPAAIELPVKRSMPESLLFRLAGILARTRDVIGIDQPWENTQLPPSALTPSREINERLAVVSGRITEKLPAVVARSSRASALCSEPCWKLEWRRGGTTHETRIRSRRWQSRAQFMIRMVFRIRGPG